MIIITEVAIKDTLRAEIFAEQIFAILALNREIKFRETW